MLKTLKLYSKYNILNIYKGEKMARKDRISQFEKDRARREENSKLLKQIAEKVEAEKNGTTIKKNFENSRNNKKDNSNFFEKLQQEKESKVAKQEEVLLNDEGQKAKSLFEKKIEQNADKVKMGSQAKFELKEDKMQKINEFLSKDSFSKNNEEVFSNDTFNKNTDATENKTQVFNGKDATKIDSKTNILELARLRQAERENLKQAKSKKVDTLDNLVLDESEVVIEEDNSEESKQIYLKEKAKQERFNHNNFQYEETDEIDEPLVDLEAINGALHIIIITFVVLLMLLALLVVYVFKHQEIMKYITFREVESANIQSEEAIKNGKNIDVIAKDVSRETDVDKKYGYIEINDVKYPIYAFNKKNAVKGMLLYRYSEEQNIATQILNVDTEYNIKGINGINNSKYIGEKLKLVLNEQKELKVEQEYKIKKIEVKSKVEIEQDSNKLYIIEKVNSKSSNMRSDSARAYERSEKDLEQDNIESNDKKIIIILEKV